MRLIIAILVICGTLALCALPLIWGWHGLVIFHAPDAAMVDAAAAIALAAPAYLAGAVLAWVHTRRPGKEPQEGITRT